jgi:pimeloyl-ACP methyl ester carboxylesterase
MNAVVEYEPRARRVELPARGGAMAVLDFGPQERPVDVVFSHANGFNARTYRTILAPLAETMRILAVDARGHGASTLPTVIEGRAGWHEFRDDFLALLEKVTDGPVVLAGHSMGGTTSLLAAAERPACAKALALFDPVLFDGARAQRDLTTGPNPLADGAERRRATFSNKAAAVAAYTGRGAFRSWRPEQLADYVEGGFRPTGEGEVTLACAPAWEASNFRIHNYDAWAAFRATRCPIRMLRAQEASTARIDDNLADLAARGVRYETVPGTTHFLPMERPDMVRAVLTELVKG